MQSDSDDHPMTRNNNTPQRSIRIPDPLWSRVQTQAAREGVSVSDLVRGLISGWLDDEDDQQEGDGNE